MSDDWLFFKVSNTDLNVVQSYTDRNLHLQNDLYFCEIRFLYVCGLKSLNCAAV